MVTFRFCLSTTGKQLNHNSTNNARIIPIQAKRNHKKNQKSQWVKVIKSMSVM